MRSRSGPVDLGRGRRRQARQVEALLSQPATVSVSATADQVSLQTSAAAGAAAGSPGVAATAGLPRDSGSPSRSATPARPTGRRSTGSGRGAGSPLDGGLGFDLGDQVSRWAGDIGGFVRRDLPVRPRRGAGRGDERRAGLRAGPSTTSSARSASSRALQRPPCPTRGSRASPYAGGGPDQVQFVQRDGKVVVGLGRTRSIRCSRRARPSTTRTRSTRPPTPSATTSRRSRSSTSCRCSSSSRASRRSRGPDYQRAKPYLDHLD